MHNVYFQVSIWIKYTENGGIHTGESGHIERYLSISEGWREKKKKAPSEFKLLLCKCWQHTTYSGRLLLFSYISAAVQPPGVVLVGKQGVLCHHAQVKYLCVSQTAIYYTLY